MGGGFSLRGIAKPPTCSESFYCSCDFLWKGSFCHISAQEPHLLGKIFFPFIFTGHVVLSVFVCKEASVRTIPASVAELFTLSFLWSGNCNQFSHLYTLLFSMEEAYGLTKEAELERLQIEFENVSKVEKTSDGCQRESVTASASSWLRLAPVCFSYNIVGVGLYFFL